MTRALYLIGPPGVGKTTLMTLLLAPYQVLAPQRVTGYTPLWVEPLLDRGRLFGYHLGKTRAEFGGTDALSMGVNTAAVNWATNADLPDLIVGEGQRLANLRFLMALGSRDDVDLTVVWLTAAQAALDQRCAARGSKQNTSWRRAAATKAANLVIDLIGAPSLDVNVIQILTDNLTPAQIAGQLSRSINDEARSA